jgi:hypothetical protein
MEAPTRAWRLRGLSGEPLAATRSSFVGREAELEQFKSILAHASVGALVRSSTCAARRASAKPAWSRRCAFRRGRGLNSSRPCTRFRRRQRAGDAVEALEYVAALEDYTRAEPLPWSDLFATHDRLLAGAARGNLDDGRREDLVRIRTALHNAGLMAFLPSHRGSAGHLTHRSPCQALNVVCCERASWRLQARE